MTRASTTLSCNIVPDAQAIPTPTLHRGMIFEAIQKAAEIGVGKGVNPAAM